MPTAERQRGRPRQGARRGAIGLAYANCSRCGTSVEVRADTATVAGRALRFPSGERAAWHGPSGLLDSQEWREWGMAPHPNLPPRGGKGFLALAGPSGLLATRERRERGKSGKRQGLVAGLPRPGTAPLDSCLRRNDERGAGPLGCWLRGNGASGGSRGSGRGWWQGCPARGQPLWIPAFAGMTLAGEVGEGQWREPEGAAAGVCRGEGEGGGAGAFFCVYGDQAVLSPIPFGRTS